VSDIKDKTKDEAKIMAGLLRAGHTMLNLACPLCNNPLFRNKENEIFCPICNKKVIIEKEDPIAASNVENIKKSEYSTQNSTKIYTQFNYNREFLVGILEQKINLISQKLEHETQMDLIERSIKALTKIFDLLNKLNKNNASAGI